MRGFNTTKSSTKKSGWLSSIQSGPKKHGSLEVWKFRRFSITHKNDVAAGDFKLNVILIGAVEREKTIRQARRGEIVSVNKKQTRASRRWNLNFFYVCFTKISIRFSRDQPRVREPRPAESQRAFTFPHTDSNCPLKCPNPISFLNVSLH